MNTPTTRELKIMFDNLQEKMEEKHNDVMKFLEGISIDLKENVKQATDTNGKVAKLYWWKNAVVWLIGAIFALIGFSFPVLRHIVQLEIKSSVSTAVNNALVDYDQIIINH